jgi:replicative DNA helicase
MINAAGKVATMAWDEKEPLAEVTEQAQALIFDSIQRRTRRGLNHISDGMQEFLTEIEARFNDPLEVTGLATGLGDLDKLLNGLKPKEVIIIAGRTGMGKTAELIAMLDGMSIDRGKRGAFFSLEMGKDELRRRLLSRRTGINTQKLDRGGLSEAEQEKVYTETGRISQAPIFISDKPAMSPSEIRAECMRQQAATGLDFVIIDYLGLMAVAGTRSRYEQVSESARACKNLAMELDVPLLVAAQLNRGSEGGADKRPTLTNLRDSGEIEEMADVVVLLYRDAYYNENSEYQNQGENIVAKHRNGPTGTVDLYWNSATASYHNLELRPIGELT